jgi:hypothetical protein
MTGKKTDNKDCAIKNPDKWGAEKSEKENNRIERSVKDDDPAKAGFFLDSRFACTKVCQPDCGSAQSTGPSAGWSLEPGSAIS